MRINLGSYERLHACKYTITSCQKLSKSYFPTYSLPIAASRLNQRSEGKAVGNDDEESSSNSNDSWQYIFSPYSTKLHFNTCKQNFIIACL